MQSRSSYDNNFSRKPVIVYILRVSMYVNFGVWVGARAVVAAPGGMRLLPAVLLLEKFGGPFCLLGAHIGIDMCLGP